jgi:pimeloyl-ACP methyl ester carboxylesterase
MWGARLAMYQPERVRGLVLAGADLAGEPTPSKRRFFQMLDTVARAGTVPPAIIEAMCPLFFSDESLAGRPALVERFRTSMTSIPRARLPGILALGRGIFGRESLTSRLREIGCPTRIIVGEQDRSRPPVESERMAQHIHRADLHVLPGAGHICNLEAPEQVTALLEDFLCSATAGG